VMQKCPILMGSITFSSRHSGPVWRGWCAPGGRVI
jgi:hypothetical protein